MAKRSGARIVTVIIIALIVVALAFGLYYVTDGFTNWNLNVNCIAGNHKFDDEGVCVSCGRQGVQDLTLFVDGMPTDGVVQSHMFSENIGLAYQLTCVVKPENAIQAKVSYKSDNEAVATVNDKGIVTIVSEGEATVTASVKRGISVQCKFVIDGSGYPDELAFEQNEYYFDTAYLETDRLRSHAVRISEEASDEFANGLEIVWASSNENVATVFAVSPTIKNAAIILRGEGTATITATMPNGVSATAQVYVGKRLNLTLKDFDPETVKIGDNYQMECEWLPKQTVTDSVLNWYSLNTEVATIDNRTGLVTIVGYGEVTFKAEVSSHSTAVDTSLTINVMSPKIETLVYTSEVTDITMSTKPWKNSFGATYSPADANTSNLQITTSDESIAVANITRAADGEVVFSVEYYSAGTVDIILTCEDKSVTLTQTVIDDSIAKIVSFLDYPENVGLTESEPTKTVEVKIAITSSMRDINKIIITSSNENVVSVADIRKDEETSAVTEYTDNFIITLNCLSEGSATIRVT